jgi:hypothetical protein
LRLLALLLLPRLLLLSWRLRLLLLLLLRGLLGLLLGSAAPPRVQQAGLWIEVMGRSD